VPGRPRDETGFRAAASAAGATVRRPPGEAGPRRAGCARPFFSFFQRPERFSHARPRRVSPAIGRPGIFRPVFPVCARPDRLVEPFRWPSSLVRGARPAA